MRMMKNLFGIAVALVALTVGANAQSVVFNGIGSSALFLELGQAAGTSILSTPAGLGATCVWSNSTSAISATDPTTSQTETGNSWIAWTPTHGSCTSAPGTSAFIYAYLQTDSTVGDRCFFNGCTIGATSSSPAGSSPSGLIFGTSGEVALNSSVWALVSGQVVNVAGTDIRPEDAAFATLRATTPCGTPVATGSQYLGLGYTAGGTPIKSFYSGSTFHVTNFTLSSSFAVTPVGAAPIVVAVNPTDTAGFGDPGVTNLSRAQLAQFLDGTLWQTSSAGGVATGIPATVIIREPLSGTYNTMEYAAPNNLSNQTSQDVGLLQPAAEVNCSAGVPLSNPMNIENGTTGSYRNRAIGTGQELNALFATGGLPYTPDALGYAFWSTANFKNATASNAKYLTIDGVDPIQSSYGTGIVPTAGNGLLPNVNFAHLNDGTYPIWSLLRLVSASPAPAQVSKIALVSQGFINNTTQPDFIPFDNTVSPGVANLQVFHSHFAPPGVTFPGAVANGTFGFSSGIAAVNCTTSVPEAGGDVGGLILGVSTPLPTGTPYQDDNDYCSSTGITTGQTGLRE